MWSLVFWAELLSPEARCEDNKWESSDLWVSKEVMSLKRGDSGSSRLRLFTNVGFWSSTLFCLFCVCNWLLTIEKFVLRFQKGNLFFLLCWNLWVNWTVELQGIFYEDPKGSNLTSVSYWRKVARVTSESKGPEDRNWG